PLPSTTDEAGVLELLQVIVDLLTSHSEPTRHAGRRVRVAQRVDDPDPERVGQRLECLRVLDRLHGPHGTLRLPRHRPTVRQRGCLDKFFIYGARARVAAGWGTRERTSP